MMFILHHIGYTLFGLTVALVLFRLMPKAIQGE